MGREEAKTTLCKLLEQEANEKEERASSLEQLVPHLGTEEERERETAMAKYLRESAARDRAMIAHVKDL